MATYRRQSCRDATNCTARFLFREHRLRTGPVAMSPAVNGGQRGPLAGPLALPPLVVPLLLDDV